MVDWEIRNLKIFKISLGTNEEIKAMRLRLTLAIIADILKR